MRRTCLAMVTCLVFAMPASALAEDLNREIARKHYELGEKFYQASNYPKALVEFKKAYELAQPPALLFNIARCHEVMAELAPAIEHYQLYLDKNPQAPNRALVEMRVKNLSERLQQQAQRSVEPGAGVHAAVVDPPVDPQTEAIAAEAGQDGRATDPADGPRPGGWKVTTGWASVGVGAGLLVTGVVFGALAQSKSDEYAEAVAKQQDFATLDEIDTSGKRYQTIQIVTLVAGGVAAAGGTALLLWHYLGDSEGAARVAVTPLFGWGGVGVGTIGRF